MADKARIEFEQLCKEGEELFEDLSKREEAYSFFAGAAERYPRNRYFKIRLTEVAIDLRKWEESHELCLLLLDQEKPKHFVYKFYFMVLMNLGKYDEALATIKKAKALYPEEDIFAAPLFIFENLFPRLERIKRVLAP